MDQLSLTLFALSNPSRRAMVDCLKKGPVRVTEIASPFDMSLNAVSKHLKVLEGAGLVRRMKRGREHYIGFRSEPLEELEKWVQHHRRFWGKQLDRMEAFFAERSK